MGNQKGSTVALAVSVALAAAILIGAATRTLLFSSHQVVYFNAMNRAYRLAETGLVRSMGELAVDPTFFISTPTMVTDVTVPGEGVYSVEITTRADVIASGYYFIVTASVTVAGKTYASRLHTHLRISNAADYFWACNHVLILAQGTDASGGKVYAPTLQFIIDAAKPATRVYKAEYMNTIIPTNVDDLAIYGSETVGTARVLLSTTNAENEFKPLKISAVVFPQVLDSDMADYRKHATNGGNIFEDCDIRGAAYNNLMNVYPPGYRGTDISGYPDPRIASKADDNKFHVWYCDGNLTIGNIRVLGQVVFAAKGNVSITGHIVSDSNRIDDPANLATTFPGAGSDPVIHKGSSTAHQAVIVTQGDVTVRNTFHPGTPGLELDQRIEAMIMAPHGRLTGESYGSGSPTHGLVRLRMVGSIIVGQVNNDPPHNFGSVFLNDPDERVYSYMSSLKTNPPFYMPSLAEIYFSYEETLGGPSIF